MKKALSIMLVVILLASGLFILTGCENGGKKFEGVEISKTYGKATYKITVPKNDDGTPKFNFTEEKPEKAAVRGSFYLETDNAVFTFGTSGLVYNTSKVYKEKYGEKEASFDGYVEWVHDEKSGIKLKGWEELEINGRKAVRYYSLEGSSGDYTYFGYNYRVSLDGIMPKSGLDLGVYYKTDEELKEPKELDEETLAILNTLSISLAEEEEWRAVTRIR